MNHPLTARAAALGTALLAMTALFTIACGSETPAAAPAATAPPVANAATPNPDPTSPGPATASSPATESSNAFLIGDGSEATFTVNEKLSSLPVPNDAVLRTGAITGQIDLDSGQASVAINLHELQSDQSRRDRYVRDRLFPRQPVTTVTFASIGAIPDGLLDGDEVSTTATGVVNVNGVDAGIEFDITARLDNGTDLFVLGAADFVWADFGMRAPVSSLFTVRDEVHVEVLLAAVKAQAPPPSR